MAKEYEYNVVKFVEEKHDPWEYMCPECIFNNVDCCKVQEDVFSDGVYCIRDYLYFVKPKTE